MGGCCHSYGISQVLGARWVPLPITGSDLEPGVEVRQLVVTVYCRRCGRSVTPAIVNGFFAADGGRLLRLQGSWEALPPPLTCGNGSGHDFRELCMLTPQDGSKHLVLLCRHCLRVALPPVG